MCHKETRIKGFRPLNCQDAEPPRIRPPACNHLTALSIVRTRNEIPACVISQREGVVQSAYLGPDLIVEQRTEVSNWTSLHLQSFARPQQAGYLVIVDPPVFLSVFHSRSADCEAWAKLICKVPSSSSFSRFYTKFTTFHLPSDVAFALSKLPSLPSTPPFSASCTSTTTAFCSDLFVS